MLHLTSISYSACNVAFVDDLYNEIVLRVNTCILFITIDFQCCVFSTFEVNFIFLHNHVLFSHTTRFTVISVLTMLAKLHRA